MTIISVWIISAIISTLCFCVLAFASYQIKGYLQLKVYAIFFMLMVFAFGPIGALLMIYAIIEKILMAYGDKNILFVSRNKKWGTKDGIAVDATRFLKDPNKALRNMRWSDDKMIRELYERRMERDTGF